MNSPSLGYKETTSPLKRLLLQTLVVYFRQHSPTQLGGTLVHPSEVQRLVELPTRTKEVLTQIYVAVEFTTLLSERVMRLLGGGVSISHLRAAHMTEIHDKEEKSAKSYEYGQ